MAAKKALRDRLTDQMGQPNFWDNPEKAQQTIQQLKPLNGLLKPFEDLESAIGDVGAMAELSAERFASAEAQEGMAAFAEKRDPSWTLHL